MKETKYTPKRLLSLLLALIMLLGMFPTATLAAGTGDEPVVTPYVKTFEGLTFEFTLDVPERPFFRYGEKRVDVHYTITKSNDNNMVSELTEFKNGEHAPVNVTAKASDEKYSAVTHEVYNKKGEIVKVFDPGTVLASGNFTYIQGTADGDVDANGKLEFVFRAKFIAAWNDQDGLQHSTADYQTGGSVDVAKIRVSNLQAGYSVSYNDGGYTGAAGIPKEVEYTTGDNALTQSYTLPSVTPTLAGCTFKGWSSNEWKKTDEDGNELMGEAALFQPGDTVEKVPSDTVLTAVWKENASEHKVEFYHNFPDGSGNSLFTTVHVADGEGAENPGAPYKHPEGYIFKDWCVKAEVGGKVTLTPYDFAAPVTEDIKLYADWTQVTEETTYTVTFDVGVANAGPVPGTQVITSGQPVPEPTVEPTRDGYTFAGWYLVQADGSLANEAYDFGTAVTKDITLRAKWTRNQVKITWPAGTSDGEFLTHTYQEDASHSTMVDVGSTVTFRVQWYKEYDPATVLANDLPLGGRVGTEDEHGVTYTYQFTANEDTTIKVNPATRKTFTITLPSANGCDVTFADCQSWRRGRDISAANGSTSYTFEYGDKFKVKLDVFADTRATLRVDGTAELSNVDGNGDNPTQTTREFTVDHAYVVTVSARAVVTRMVTFSLEPYGSIYSIQYVENGSTLTKPANPQIPGYEFVDKWTTEPNGGGREWKFGKETGDKVTSNLVLYGQLTALTYDVTYNANLPANTDATVTVPGKQTKTHGEALTLVGEPTALTGYTFKGWATSADGPVAYQPGGQYLNDAPVTLYAVWEKLTYTVTISSGAGYSTVPAGVATVNWHDPFTFTVNVDRQYAATVPEVVDSVEGKLTKVTGDFNNTGATSYTYKIGEKKLIEQNRNITITVTQNAVHQVSFKVSKVTPGANGTSSTVTEEAPFLIQSVEHGYYASMPAAPEREGFKFKGYYKENNTTVFPFNDAILADATVHAVYEAIQPKITVTPVSGTGWALANWKYGKQDPLAAADPATTNPFTIAYGDDVTFDLVIQPGFDYSKLSVSANGYELGRENIKTDDKGVTTISFRLVYVTANTRITVSGIERKTITVTYNENALDHVSNLPAPQTANYYIHGDGNNTKFTDQVPVRNGYTFLGWALSGTATTPDYTAAAIKEGLKIPFTKDTTVYAIWAAKDLSAELLISDEFINSSSSAHQLLDYAYEGERIYLTGKLSAPAQGTMTFYKRLTKPGTIWVAAEDWTLIGTATVNGSQYGTIETTAEPYRWDNLSEVHAKNYRWDYKVVFTPANEEGYKECTGHDDLRVYSKAISWAVTKKTEANWSWVDAQNKLTIYTNEARTDKTTTMTANNTYWLQIPKVIELDGGLNLKNDNYTYLTVGQHYEIIWEYQDSENHWTTYTTTTDTDWVKVTPEFSGYTFRAKVKPSANSIYTKAATYTDANALVPDVYWDYLITAPTNATEVEDTKTTLTIDTDDELNSIVIKDETPFETLGAGSHKAQFEGQTITLTAKVTKTDETTAVNMGTVEFYRQVTDENGNNNWVLIGTAKLEDEGTVTGEASIEFRMPKYVTGKTPLQNKEVFKAVYVQNVTYKTSESANSEAYIKSAQLQIPVIADVDTPTAHTGKWIDAQGQEVANGDNKTATSYDYHLGGLTAGIKHTFQLKQTGANKVDKADWSVVALDGRTVAGDMYTMKWETLTDANWKTTTTTGDTYTAETTKVGDRYHILLTGAKNSPFEGSEAVSKDIAIGDPQGVTVTVEAIDAIKATEVDRNNGKYPDVYQLNEITLTATVEAAEAGADRKPTGTVAFYYVDEDGKFQPLGEAELKPDTSGKMVAQITTDELPVEKKAGKNTNLTSVITAVYYGDETFKPSENWDEANKKVTNAEVKDAADKYLVKSDTVTVYSSVVYNCKDENKKQEACSEKGIHIKVEDGVFKANEQNVVLKLSDIYTLDRELGENLLDIIAKLTPGMDYTIQWQKLNNANAFSDKDGADFTDSKHWQDIADATGVTVVLGTVEQNTAYRAVITVKDQPITKGSYTKVKQAVEGRQVYYSNILMPTDTSITMSVMVNTDKNGENLEGITEGETVTANVFLSGVTGSVPNAEIEVRIEADAAKGNDKNYAKSFTKATVNGWNSIDWDTKDVEPGFYTMKITAKTNTGYATKIFERSIIVRESSYDFNIGNQTTTYNGQTQGVTVTLNGFDFKGSDINEAAKKSWTVKYYKGEVKPENLVEPSQAGTYKAVVTLPGSAYWTEHSETVDFTISKRSVSIADAVAQAKVYDNSTDVNIVEVILNDATTAQDSTGLPTNNIGIINGDSIYAVVTGAKLSQADAGERYFEINKDFSKVDLLGDDAKNYKWDEATYTENIYVSRSQVYGETGTLKLKKGEDFPADQVIKMIDQAGNKLEANKGYTLTFYYHSDTEIKQTNDLSKTGLYTVVARPNQANYKSGITMKFEVVNDATTYTPAAEPKPSTLITISNTAELYGNTGNTGVQTSFTNSATLFKIEYQNGANWTKTRPTDAGRYLLKVTATTGDVAYGIYTITKAHPSISITAAEATYNSMPYTGAATDLTKATENPEHYLTYAGDVAIGYYATEADQKNGNVAEQAPVDAGDYVVTLHVNETQNYTAHEVSAPFVINKAPLTIQADSRKTTQYDAFPTMTATYDGLAAETNDGTPDTSLRDVQIAPEFIYNPTNDKPNYSNATLDQVGKVAVQPIDALAKNYKLSYGDGEYVKSETESNPDLEILGLPQSGEKDSTGNKYVAKVYYGDEIQLYPYGNYTKWANGSSELTWSIENAQVTDGHGSFSIGEKTGILKVDAIGTFTVKLTRGEGEQKIETSVTVTAIRKEAKIALKEVDKVYNGNAQTYDFANITVHDDLYREITPFGEGKLNRTKLSRKDIGTQIPTATVNTSTTGSWYYQSETYGGQFTINDKEATVAPGAQTTVYGTTEQYEATKWTVDGKVGSVEPVSDLNVASQTDVYDRLDVYDGYEILVAGTEDMNYNVKYKTDHNDPAKDAADSKVATYGGVKFTSETKSKTTAYLNDATVYGETPNVLDWTLEKTIKSSRGGEPYADNLADFDLESIFVEQDYDNCVGNADCGKFDYKAANRTTEPKADYNKAVLDVVRTATDTAKDENYTLKFKTVTNSGALNYQLTDAQEGNKNTTTNALRAGSLGYDGGNATLEDGENFVEGSANIAQRPVTVKKASTIGTVSLYWRLPQSKLYTALLNILEAEENSTNRGLAKGHTIRDLDLTISIQGKTIDPNSDNALEGLTKGDAQVVVKVGDTNYVLDGDGKIDGVELKTIQIEATYTTKTATNFVVLIKVRNEDGSSTTPLKRADGLTYEILRKVNGSFDGKVYATGSLTYTGRTATDKFGDECGVFTASYGPLSNIGGTYFIQMYEYGVALKTKNS